MKKKSKRALMIPMKLSDIHQLQSKQQSLKNKLGLRGSVMPGALIEKARLVQDKQKNLNTITKDPVTKLAIKGLI